MTWFWHWSTFEFYCSYHSYFIGSQDNPQKGETNTCKDTDSPGKQNQVLVGACLLSITSAVACSLLSAGRVQPVFQAANQQKIQGLSEITAEQNHQTWGVLQKVTYTELDPRILGAIGSLLLFWYMYWWCHAVECVTSCFPTGVFSKVIKC